ncbi:MAG TPA: hypothetical protein VMS17_00065 [Gemmataceae bacterium]|nr:hypothetical protein [Gemmataceae bacterium]
MRPGNWLIVLSLAYLTAGCVRVSSSQAPAGGGTNQEGSVEIAGGTSYYRTVAVKTGEEVEAEVHASSAVDVRLYVVTAGGEEKDIYPERDVGIGAMMFRTAPADGTATFKVSAPLIIRAGSVDQTKTTAEVTLKNNGLIQHGSAELPNGKGSWTYDVKSGEEVRGRVINASSPVNARLYVATAGGEEKVIGEAKGVQTIELGGKAPADGTLTLDIQAVSGGRTTLGFSLQKK